MKKLNTFYELKREVLDLFQVLLLDARNDTDHFKVENIEKVFDKAKKNKQKTFTSTRDKAKKILVDENVD